jgi:hypothetical protein
MLRTFHNAKLRQHVPLCIEGMHLSGTSMVARLVQGCGLFLGREE